MLEHTPWILRADYEAGLDGQRICVVGYSHHHDQGDADEEGFTRWVVENHIKGDLGRNSFFPYVQRYFGSESAIFWNRVLFFNFLPNVIGSSDRKYAIGTPEQVDQAKKRFHRIVGDYEPHKIFVFSTKAWGDIVGLLEKTQHLRTGVEVSKFSWGVYRVGSYESLVFGLRHPQYAQGNLMKAAVRAALDFPLNETGDQEVGHLQESIPKAS